MHPDDSEIILGFIQPLNTNKLFCQKINKSSAKLIKEFIVFLVIDLKKLSENIKNIH